MPSTDISTPTLIEDNNVTWEVVKHIIDVSSAAQTLNDIKNWLNDSPIVYFETNLPDAKSTVNRNVKDVIATQINPLFKLEILDDANNEWDKEHERLRFNLKVTNTTDTDDVASTTDLDKHGEFIWSVFQITVKKAENVQAYQEYMLQSVKKRLDKKDTTFTKLWEVEGKKTDETKTGGSSVYTVTTTDSPDHIVISGGKYLYEWSVELTSKGTRISVDDSDNDIWRQNVITVTARANDYLVTFRPINALTNADTFDIHITNESDFKELLTQYSLDMLDGFAKSYGDCRDTLLANKINSQSSDFHGVDLYGTIYLPYDYRIACIEREEAEREKMVTYWYNDDTQKDEGGEIPVGELVPYNPEEPIGKVQEYYNQMVLIHKQLDLKNFIGEDDWKILFNYLREGEYQNANIISEGLSDTEQIEYAVELLEKAQKELEKASQLQYTLSDDLENLLNTEEFAPFKDKFQLGDYIICGIGDYKEDTLDMDDQLYKLRLIGVSYNYGSPESLSVTFSNVTKVTNYFSDAQSVLSQAKSMASSYSYVTQQVEKNTDTTNQVSFWNRSGLNSSLTRIMNNTNQEVTYDNSGITIRQYDMTYDDSKDNTEGYGDEQLRITNNILAFTQDNWKTASLGLGKQDYEYYNENGVKTSGVGYGMIAKFVDAGYIHGTQIIGGDLYSEVTYPTSGGGTAPVSHMDWNTGTFELAKGNLTYNEQDGLSITANVNIIGDLTVSKNSNVIFDADFTNGIVEIGGFQVSKDALYKNVTSLSDTSHNGIYIGSDGADIGIRSQNGSNYVLIKNGGITANSVDLSGDFTTVGSTYTTTISSDNFKVSNNASPTKYISLQAESWTPPGSSSSYTSGSIYITEGTNSYSSRLTSRELEIDRVEASNIYCSGAADNTATLPNWNCGYLCATPTGNNKYSGQLYLNGNQADIKINNSSILKYINGDVYNFNWWGGGYITELKSGTTLGTKIYITIPLPKNAIGRNIILDSTTATVVYEGNYLVGSSSGMVSVTPTGSIGSDGNTATIVLANSNGFANSKNNSAVAVHISGYILFS